MRIGIDARLWNQTGVGRYIRNLVLNLLAIDKKNDFVLFAYNENYEEIKIQISKIKNTNQNLKIVEANFRWHSIEEQRQFPRILNKENLDLMHFTYFSVPMLYKKPFVVTIHDLIINHFPTGQASTLPYFFYYLKHSGYKLVLSQAIKNAKKIIVPLSCVKKDLESIYNHAEGKVVVTYEGADEFQNIKNVIKPVVDYKYFFYAGNAYPHKNLENLIDGFLKFRAKNQDVKLILAGKEDYFYTRLKDKIKNEHENGIIFKFNLSDEELAGFYKNALAYCSASKMEGFGLTPIEAAVCGSILVLSDIPAFREIWEENAIYFDPINIDDIAEKFRKVFKLDSKERENLIKINQEKVKSFSWKDTAKKTLQIYENSFGI